MDELEPRKFDTKYGPIDLASAIGVISYANASDASQSVNGTQRVWDPCTGVECDLDELPHEVQETIEQRFSEESRRWEERELALEPVHRRRRSAGERIDPSTAEVWFVYGVGLDPYRDHPVEDLSWYGVGREWFTRDPEERIAVHFRDLPETIQDQLEEKRRLADREGWERIRRIGST